MSIRRLNAESDYPLFEAMYGWLQDSPGWRRETEAIFGTMDHEEYIAATHNPERVDIGIFEDDELIADVILTLRAKHTYEVHLEAKRGANAGAILEAGREILATMFGRYGAKFAFMWTPSWNRAVIALNSAIGFHTDNVTMLHGTCRGRLVEWVRQSYGR